MRPHVVLPVLCLALAAASCRPSLRHGAETASSRPRITLALNWFPEVEHGGYFAAEVHGYFDAEGLDVEILPGGPGAPVMQQVAAGRCDFAVANADQVLLGRDQLAPVVAVMAPLQDSPHCIMVHASSGLTSLLELRNLTLAVGTGKPLATYLLHRLGDAHLQVVPYQGNVSLFLTRTDVAQQAYVFSEPFVARQQGADPRCLMLSDIGFNPYTSVLIVHERRIAQDPELVGRMVRACVRGWQHYLKDPVPTNQRIAARNSEMTLEALAYGAAEMHKLCLPGALDPNHLGTMTAARWEELAQRLDEVRLLDRRNSWSDAFDTRFLPTVNAATP